VSVGSRPLRALDRAAYALFSRRADDRRHDADRRRYRGTRLGVSFEVFLARLYATSWLVAALAAVGGGGLALATVPDTAFPVSRPQAAVVAGLLAAAVVKRAAVGLGGRYLGWRARARRGEIERTLPGAVRYLRALSSGSDGERDLLRRVADQERAYGETAVAFRRALDKAALTGSLDAGVRLVARDTPSEDTLAPFLLKFREYAAQGGDAVEEFLRLESRMMARRQERERRRAEGFLELLAELFIVLLVLPTLLVIVLTVLAVLSPGLNRPVPTPLGPFRVRVLLVYASGGFVLVIGAVTAWIVATVRPANAAGTAPERSTTAGQLVRTALRNPANAAVALAPVAAAVGAGAAVLGARPTNALLAAYAAYGVAVGGVALRRASLDAAKDREMKDFVHAVAGHVSLGRPFPEAVERVAADVDLGALNDDVANLAFNMGVTARGDDVRSAALSRFVTSVGTPLAEQTVGLVRGALDAGSDPDTVFDTLQAEVGRLHHEKRALRANVLVYVAVGWTTAVLVVGVMAAVNIYVLESFADLAAVSQSMGGLVLDPTAVDPAEDRYRFYLVTQATMVACGWFAGYASRGRYEALFHSGALVAVAYAAFTLTGAI
jgi:archaellum biogenesis protein FlaJ (TadC family)